MFQIHHILPRAVYREFADKIDTWTDGRYNHHGGYNLVPLPTDFDDAQNANLPRHGSNHGPLQDSWERVLNFIDTMVPDDQKGAYFSGFHAAYRGRTFVREDFGI